MESKTLDINNSKHGFFIIPNIKKNSSLEHEVAVLAAELYKEIAKKVPSFEVKDKNSQEERAEFVSWTVKDVLEFLKIKVRYTPKKNSFDTIKGRGKDAIYSTIKFMTHQKSLRVYKNYMRNELDIKACSGFCCSRVRGTERPITVLLGLCKRKFTSTICVKTTDPKTNEEYNPTLLLVILVHEYIHLADDIQMFLGYGKRRVRKMLIKELEKSLSKYFEFSFEE